MQRFLLSCLLNLFIVSPLFASEPIPTTIPSATSSQTHSTNDVEKLNSKLLPSEADNQTSTAISAEKNKSKSTILSVNDNIKNSIVKIYTVSNIPKYRTPWNSNTSSATGSGSIIQGNRILTNAHVVANSTFIQVKRFGETKRYEAKVVNVSHAADLALLEVNDPNFFEGAVPLSFGELPQIQQEVLVYGFPTGGGGMSVTKGVVSRIEYQRYAHSGELLLAVQVDAAINSGNSGGPVMSKGKQIGVVMQKRTRAENIGYMVPMPVIQHFLTDIADKKQDGFPGLGIQTQTMENPFSKKKYLVPDGQTGILVYRVDYNSPAKGDIQVNDVITAIDGHNITDTEEVEYRPNEYLSYWYYVDQKQIGDEVVFDILRQGVAKKVTVKLTDSYKQYRLVPYEQYDKQPTYVIFGGLVFMPLTTNYLLESAWNSELIYQPATLEKQEVVVLTQVLADSVNRGYHDLNDVIVEKVNGQSFKDMQAFYQIITQSKDDYLVFSDDMGYQVIINRSASIEKNPSILQRYGIPKSQSDDLSTLSRKGK
ncbi:MAG: S1C family serine protease [bacterium]